MQRQRRDLQGLRAVAIVVVIANHLTGFPASGYVGVDVFFVLSGFLITGLLIRAHDTTGHLSLASFYRRRARRILPAAVVVLVVTTALSSALFLSQRALSVLTDATSALAFVANWRFLALGTDYLTRSASASPLQNFWSLAVEEQFYLIWPLLLLLVLGLAARRRTLPLVVLGVIVLVSLAWSIVESRIDPAAAYFDTFTRIWELGAGGLLALGASRFVGIPRPVRTIVSYVGLATIIVSVIVPTPVGDTPAPFGLLPVVATLLVISAGIGTEPDRQYVLANPVSGYLGNISYSLYLWHFPIIVFLAVVVPPTSRAFVPLAIVASLVLAHATYSLVENPLRSSPLFERFSSVSDRRSRVAAWATSFGPGVRRALPVCFVLVLVCVGALGGVVVVEHSEALSAARERTASSAPEGKTATQRLASDLTTAAAATTWPRLSPSPESADTAGIPLEEKDGCQLTDVDDATSCSFGDPRDPAIVVVGDSLGVALLPTIRAAYGAHYYIRGITMSDCALIDINVNFDSAALGNECLATRAAAVRAVRALHPRAVFVTENYEWLGRLQSGATGRAAQAEWARAAASTAAKLAPLTRHLVFVTPPPSGTAIADCDTAISTPASCLYPIPPQWTEGEAAERSLVRGNVSLLNTIGWYCDPAHTCPIFAEGITIKRDGAHPTRQWSVRLAPLFYSATRGDVS
jgi:peptidoglycan/LPS O-acetylase OafA/YrhL